MLKQALNDDDLEFVAGGIQISRQSETCGKVFFNGQEYPFTDYAGLMSVAQSCVNAGTYSDDDLFNAFKAAGII